MQSGRHTHRNIIIGHIKPVSYTHLYIEKLHTGVTSDVNGFYTFPNLDPGTYTVKVSYVGYSLSLIHI